jgi:pectate lyase
MKKCLLFLSILVSGVTVLFAQDTLIIQEDTLGLCTYDGNIVRTHAPSTDGWTGPGYIDANNGIGVSISYGKF